MPDSISARAFSDQLATTQWPVNPEGAFPVGTTVIKMGSDRPANDFCAGYFTGGADGCAFVNWLLRHVH